MSGNDFTVPDDLSELLGPRQADSGAAMDLPEPAPPQRVPAELCGVAGASSRAQLDTGRMLFGRRMSTEQRALREQVKAEQRVGAALDWLTRIGARVLHDRRTPVGHGQVDHIVINGAGVHLVETLTVSDKAALRVDAAGYPFVGQLPIRHRLTHLGDLAGELANATNTVMGRPRGLRVYPTIAVVGGATRRAFTFHDDADVVPVDLLRSWVSRLPAVYDALDIAAFTDAVAEVCPPYNLAR